MKLPSTIEEVISLHVARNFGRSGFREVTLTVTTNDEAAFTYRILHVWLLEGDKCSSLYYLAEPLILSGTSVLLVERPYVTSLDIWLRLRTTEQAIRVDSYRAGQFVLGTDFTYQDLRFWLPTDAFIFDSFDLTGNQEILQCKISARQTNHDEPREVKLILDGKHWIPLNIEWLERSGTTPQRIYSATHLISIDEISTPRVISVCRPREQYKSIMVLRRVNYNVTVEPSFLQVENMTTLSLSDFDGWFANAQAFLDE